MADWKRVEEGLARYESADFFAATLNAMRRLVEMMKEDGGFEDAHPVLSHHWLTLMRGRAKRSICIWHHKGDEYTVSFLDPPMELNEEQRVREADVLRVVRERLETVRHDLVPEWISVEEWFALFGKYRIFAPMRIGMPKLLEMMKQDGRFEDARPVISHASLRLMCGDAKRSVSVKFHKDDTYTVSFLDPPHEFSEHQPVGESDVLRVLRERLDTLKDS